MTFRNNSAGFLANHMARLFANALHRRIRPLGLAPAQFMTLLELWEEDGLTQGELVRRLDVEQATMANTLMRMERDGLIERRALPDDARSRSIHLTQRAQELRGPALAAARGVNQVALGDLDAAGRAEFLKLMHAVIRSLQAELGD